MFKKIANGAGMALSFVSMGTMASAGSLAEGVAEPVVEDLVIEEADPTSGAWLPLVGLLVIGAVIIASDNDDGDSDPDPKKKSDPKTRF